jgi:hypothetical protein
MLTYKNNHLADLKQRVNDKLDYFDWRQNWHWNTAASVFCVHTACIPRPIPHITGENSVNGMATNNGHGKYLYCFFGGKAERLIYL